MRKCLKYMLFFMFLFGLNFIIVNFSFAGDDCNRGKRTIPRMEMPSQMEKIKNPLSASSENIAEGKRLYVKEAKPAACGKCHGDTGKADGMMSKYLRPRPRDFTCKNIMGEITDGAMFWLVRRGGVGSSMAAYNERLLDDDKLWKIILYIRSLAK